MLNEYIPNVMVVGDVERFRARASRAGRAARVVGEVSFFGKLDDQPYDLIKDKKFLLDGELVDAEYLKVLVERNAFDYMIFMDYVDILMFTAFLVKQARLVPSEQLISIDTFICCVKNNFYSFNNETTLYRMVVSQKYRTLLDVDAYFADNYLYVKPVSDIALTVDGILSEPTLPIFSNIYTRYYRSIADCAFRRYDAVLLTAERDWESLITTLYELDNITETFIIFVRNNSPLTKFADEDRWPRDFTKVNYNQVLNGRWFIISKNPPSDVGLYVVTHKKYDVPGLPECYKSIHAGRALADDLGYIGDDTGRSISELNPYLNEMTAAYWIWKNTNHDIVGISHYRRFFSSRNSRDFIAKNIVTDTQAIEALRYSDMVVALEDNFGYNQYGFLINDVGQNITTTALTMLRAMMRIHQPEYVDVFDRFMSSCAMFRCNMMITRKYIFDAYCEWLFSFLLPAQAEFMHMAPLEKLSVNQKRIFGYLAERMMNIWLLKNNLRLKELPIMEKLDRPKQLTPQEDIVQIVESKEDEQTSAPVEAEV